MFPHSPAPLIASRQIRIIETVAEGGAAGNHLRGVLPACVNARGAKSRPEFHGRAENCDVVTRPANECPGVSRLCPGSFVIIERRKALRCNACGDLSRLSRLSRSILGE